MRRWSIAAGTPSGGIRYLTDAARRWRAGLRRANSRERGQLVQIAKATAAAVLAWVAAARLPDAEVAWLAPMTAVLMVRATAYRSLAESGRRIVAVALGVLLATSAGRLVGLNALGLLLVVPVALVLAQWRRMGEQRDYIPATAVLLLTFGVADSGQYLVTYVWETALGAAVGSAINVLVLPPTFLRDAGSSVHELAVEIGTLLRDMADGIDRGWDAEQAASWFDRARRLDQEAAETRAVLERVREGKWWNPRARWYASSIPLAPAFRAMDRCWHAVIDTIGIARTMSEAAEREEEAVIPDADFRAGLVDTLRDAADVVSAEPDATNAADMLAGRQRLLIEMARRIERTDTVAVPSWLLPAAMLADVRRLCTHLAEDGPASTSRSAGTGRGG